MHNMKGHYMNYRLKKLSLEDGMDIYEMLQQIPENENGFINEIYGKTYTQYKQWLMKCFNESGQKCIIDGWKVPQTYYWFYFEEKPVGLGKLRHFLTEDLLIDGGSIGYSVCPKERNQGYASLLLRELLKEAHELNIKKVLLVVRNDNIPSIKTALNNGGIISKRSEEKNYIWINCS